MRDSTPAKLFLGVAAASLAALGIVMVASSIPAPAIEPDNFEPVPEVATPAPRVKTSPPPPIVMIPAPSEHGRPIPAPSR